MLLLKLLLLILVKNKPVKHEKMSSAKTSCYAKKPTDCPVIFNVM